jgi:hypothetical protein
MSSRFHHHLRRRFLNHGCPNRCLARHTHLIRR